MACGAWALIAPCALAAGGERPEDVAAAVRAAAQGTIPPGAELTLGDVSAAAKMAACSAPLAVSLMGAAPQMEAVARCPSPGWVYYVPLSVAQTRQMVVAARPLAAGTVLGAGDVALVTAPSGGAGGQAGFDNPAAVAGMAAAMPIAAGAMISPGQLVAPVVVKAGQSVVVAVRDQGVEVTVMAVADEPGRLGQMMLLTNPGSGRRFSALVTADGPLVDLQNPAATGD